MLQAGAPTLLPIMPTIPKSLRPRLSRLAPATAPAAPAPSRARRRPEAFDQPRPRAATRRRALPFPELGALLLLAGVLNLWALDRNGWANEYYSAAVRSMSTSWHNFLYDSFDPSGLMTVDKPPLALWVQALSARVFGFHSWSILVPQALMGVATVALVYDLTRRLWGRTAGFVAGLVLAVTPITVAISRHNNPDALLALCCVGALWCLVRALQDGRTRWIVLAGVCVGLGFETKMGAALLVVPAIVAAWLWVAPRGRLAAMRQLLAGGAAMVVVGGAWPLLMMLTPAVEPPVDLGHERQQHPQPDPRLQRPRAPRRAGRRPADRGRRRVRAAARRSAAPPARCACSTRASAGRPAGCSASPLVAIVALAVATRLRRADARTGWLIATGGMFLTTAVAFSFAQGIFHPYYVAQLAPFTAALVGAGSGWFLSRHRAAGIGRGRGAGGRRGDRAARPAQPPRPADVAARRPARRRRGDRRGPRRRARTAARRRPRGRARAAAARPRELGRADARPRHRGHVPRGRAGAGRLRRRPPAAVAAAARRRRLRRSPRRRQRASPRRPPAPAARFGGGRGGAAAGGAGGGMAAAASAATTPG